MTNVETQKIPPKEGLENRENIFDKLREQRKGLSIETSENLKLVKEEKVKDLKKYAGISRPTLIENNNLRGGAPGKPSGGSKRTYEAAEAAVETIFDNFHPKSVIILEHNGESGLPKEGKNEASLWKSKGVKVIEMPIGGNEMEKLFFPKNIGDIEGYSTEELISKLKINPKVLEAFKALDEGNSYVHCTHGAHRAVALVEMWRATRGIDRRPDMDANKNYNGSMQECRKDAKKIIEVLLALQKSGEISSNMATPGEKEKLAEAVGETLAPEAIQSSQSTEHLSEKSKELQQKLEKEIEAITEEQRKADEQKLSQAEIKDIRFNTALLNGDEDKVKEEMTHRLAQYTEKQADGGLKINYAKFNLSGRDHEMNIGLGDVMPPEYKRIVVVTSGGTVRIGARGLTNTSRESNRIGYIDESTGGYLATFTGDTIYVLDPPLTDEKELAELIKKEKEARKNGAQNFSEYTQPSYGETYPVQQQSGSEQTETVNMPPEGPLAQEAANNAAEECSNHGMTIEQAVKKPNLMKVISHVAKASKIPVYAIIAILRQECGFKFYPPVVGDNGAAVGMAQHHIAGWEELKKTRLFQETVKPYTNKNPATLDRGENIVADILSIAIRLKDGANALGFNIDDTTDLTKDAPIQKGPTGLAMTRLEWLRAYYKRPGDIGPFINPDKYYRAGKASRVERARRSIPGDRKSYKEFNDNSALARNAFEATYGSQSKYAETQQPSQPAESAATGLTPKEKAVAESIRSMPKPSFDYDAVYVLGCREPEENQERAVAAAELALKNHAAFLTSGGATSKYRARGTTEGRGAYDYIINNPYYKTKFVEAGIQTGIEDQSEDTGENVSKALAFFRAQGYKKILIVTTESGHGTRPTHGAEGRDKFNRKLKREGVEVSFYTPERPNIDRNLA